MAREGGLLRACRMAAVRASAGLESTDVCAVRRLEGEPRLLLVPPSGDRGRSPLRRPAEEPPAREGVVLPDFSSDCTTALPSNIEPRLACGDVRGRWAGRAGWMMSQ